METKKPDPQKIKDTFGLFLKQSDVNYQFTNLVLTDKAKALELAKRISSDCDVSCYVVDESFTLVHDD